MRPLAVIGNVNVDLILGPLAAWPAMGTEIAVDHDELRVGGAAGNCALTWSALGVDYDIAANVGSDEFGRWLRDAFGDKASCWPERPESTTLSIGITHPDGERTFLTTRGHLPHFSLEDVFACLDGGKLAGGWALLCGPFLTDALTRRYGELFDWADCHGIALALDTGWPLAGWTAEIRGAVRSWLARCRLVLLNEAEVTALTETPDPAAALRQARSWMPEGAVAVVKRGARGAMAVDGGGSLLSAAPPPVSVVDSIGAGDIFNAAFLAARARDLNLKACLAAGVSTASHAIATCPRNYGGIAAAVEAGS